VKTASEIRTLTVIGAGTMGHGIAHVAAVAGIEVRLFDAIAGAAAAGIAKLTKNLDKGVELGKVTAADRDAAIARVHPVEQIAAACADTDCVIEAVPEKLDLKREIFAAADRAAPKALLATNTSSLPVAEIAKAVADPSRVVGMHFFNPVHVMKLVEVVTHPRAARGAAERAVTFARQLGKEPIVVNDSPGFASSRLGVVLGLEAMRMLEQGVASAEDIDKAMELGYNHPMGPLKVTDLVGLDVRLAIAEYLYRSLEEAQFEPPAILREKVKKGELGRKTGKGFYTWSD
jgi:3-hydroxybutyryl-CoA dehydrogenase